jgi:hypothetical protein
MQKIITIPPAVAAVIPYGQLQVTRQHPDAYAEPLERLTKAIQNIPSIGATGGMKEHPAILHYFIGATDIFVTEYDGKDEMFGFTILNGDYEMAEFGYISLAELRRISRMNLDYYWEGPSVEMARYKLYPHYFKRP